MAYVPPSGRYDAIVVGVGAMGSAASYHLARRGKRVLGLERFGIPHAMGSSHGHTRIIRMAYYEDPTYVPLIVRAYELWRELEETAGEKLLYTTGSVVATVSVSGPAFRMPAESIREIAGPVREAAAEISQCVGFRSIGDGASP